MNIQKSKELYEQSCQYIPGGVNSPVRAFRSVGMEPIFVTGAKGAYITDADGNTYIDYIGSWGPMILGHASEVGLQGIESVLCSGTSFGAATGIEVQLAKMIVDTYPSIDMVRMVNSGTEATMSALRVARGYTGRDKILKFEGCYHGHSDALLVKSGSGTLTYGVPTSLGVPANTVKDTIVGRYNDIDNLREVFVSNKGELAAVIVEPVAGNMGVVPPKQEFLQELRKLTKEHGTILIFDEVITGFRMAFGGAQEYFGIVPDMTCLGKIIGGGLPVGAYGGKQEIMEVVAPLGGVYQAGTLSGNPVAMHMGLNILRYLKSHKDVYMRLETRAKQLQAGFEQNIKDTGAKAVTTRVGGMLCMFLYRPQCDDIRRCDDERYRYVCTVFQRHAGAGCTNAARAV